MMSYCIGLLESIKSANKSSTVFIQQVVSRMQPEAFTLRNVVTIVKKCSN